jgi:hypothetical protein
MPTESYQSSCGGKDIGRCDVVRSRKLASWWWPKPESREGMSASIASVCTCSIHKLTFTAAADKWKRPAISRTISLSEYPVMTAVKVVELSWKRRTRRPRTRSRYVHSAVREPMSSTGCLVYRHLFTIIHNGQPHRQRQGTHPRTMGKR